MIRLCNPADFGEIWTIINDGAEAYRGVIPADRWAEPYMSREKLRDEIALGVAFWAIEQDGALQGVMGIQDVLDVTLIRHAYVRTRKRRSGFGGMLLSHLQSLTKKQLLVGTWTDANWAIRFYEKHGFTLVDSEEKLRLLRRYWNVPERQIDTSVVLRRWPTEWPLIDDHYQN
jgi:N-acetylglutamate synthase-like GNAT family acetyltransferase